MPYIERDKDHKIIAIYKDRKPGLEKACIVSDSEVMAFLLADQEFNQENNLSMLASDIVFVCVLEDLIDILIKKNIVLFTDFPEEAIKRMQEREKLRERLQQFRSALPGDEGFKF